MSCPQKSNPKGSMVESSKVPLQLNYPALSLKQFLQSTSSTKHNIQLHVHFKNHLNSQAKKLNRGMQGDHQQQAIQEFSL